ncbi:FecR family protein [Bradyrhizobium arachidis]|uniref:FecR family protein n=1 Tax=Bradyrhizobium arachidis TaxID=858423 RepID=UPI002868288B|nr:FecR family protein [Bradyrhizobium arachidis]
MVAGFVLALSSFLPSAARAQTESAKPAVGSSSSKPIGKVVAATGSVTIEHAGAVVVQAGVSGEPGRTNIGDLVYLGDVVRTGADGRVGINFSDGTSFNLSSNAHMALDQYVYDPDGKSNSTLFNLTRGTFTFVAGSIARTGDMKVDTPVATMGIRGTTPHIEISDDGTAKFATLIEEGKSSILKKPAAAAPPPPDRGINRKLNICRGC